MTGRRMAAEEMMSMYLSEKIMKEMRRRRRDFHKYPESGWTEFRTTALAAQILESLGWKLTFASELIRAEDVMGRNIDAEAERRRAIAQGAEPLTVARIGEYTGLIAELDTGRDGPLTALRFDIDCVETEEAEDAGHLPAREGFRSVNRGRMHACGHDGHTAIGLALAELAAEAREALRGKIRLIFQPAEEGVRGGYALSSAGAADSADYFIAMHLGMGLPTGHICGGTHGFLCSTKFDADFRGIGAHAGSEPERGRNALLAAASAALNIQAIAPHSGGTTRVNVGRLDAGTGRNVVPPRAHMEAEARGESGELAAYVYGRAKEIINGAAEMYGVEAAITKQGETVSAASDEALAALVAEEAASVKGAARRDIDRAASGSDDACWFMRRVQERGGLATYIGIGADTAAGHHNDRFDFDEKAMDIALELLFKCLLRIGGRR